MKKGTKKLLSTLLAAALTLSMSACGSLTSSDTGSSSAGTASSTGETSTENSSSEETAAGDSDYHSITVVYNQNATSLYPFQALGPALGSFMYQVYETLYIRSEDGNSFDPLIAEGYEQADEEGYVYDIYLKDYVHDSEGNNITASDVIWSLEQAIQSGSGTNRGMSKIENMEAIDDYTVQMTLSTNSREVLQMILYSCPIISKAAFDASDDQMATACVGTGPYVLSNFVSGSSLKLTINENYWETDESKKCWAAATNVDEINVQYIAEANQAEIALETGAADICFNMDASSVDKFAANENYEVVETADLNVNLLVLSGIESSPFSDLRVRQAMAYAIEQQGIIDAVFYGHAEPAANSLNMAPDYQETWKNESFYEYNPDKAKELLAEAGYGEGECHIKFIAGPAGKARAELVQAYLNAVGFDVEIEILENALYLTTITDPTQYDMGILSDGRDYNVLHYTARYDARNYSHEGTYSGFVDDELQALMEAIDKPDHTEADLTAAYEYINENVIEYPMLRMHSITVYNKNCGLEEVKTCMLPGSARMFNASKYSWN